MMAKDRRICTKCKCPVGTGYGTPRCLCDAINQNRGLPPRPLQEREKTWVKDEGQFNLSPGVNCVK